MTALPRKKLITKAWNDFLDPGLYGRDLDGAEFVLARVGDGLRVYFNRVRPREIVDLAPDRLLRLAKLAESIDDYQAPKALADALVVAFDSARGACEAEWALWPLRRAQALAELLSWVGASARLSPADLLWLRDDLPPARYYELLEGWCSTRDPVPTEIVELVRALCPDEVDAATLARLNDLMPPSTSPSYVAERERINRELDNYGWIEAKRQRARDGHDVGEDEPMLRKILEYSTSTSRTEIATTFHGDDAVEALRQARAAEASPMERKIYDKWIESFEAAG
jgi:hypothetical protein